MAKNSTYISELKALLDVYGAAVIAKLLGVTERGIDYWLSPSPKVPRSETQRTIHELFLKHDFGEDIRLSEKPGLKDELLQSYKDQVTLLKEEVTNLRSRLSLKQAELTEIGQINQSLLLTNQDILIQLLSLQKKQETKKTAYEVGKVNAQNYQIVKKKGTPVDADR